MLGVPVAIFGVTAITGVVGADHVVGAATNVEPVSYTHLRAHETVLDLVCRLLLDKKQQILLPHLTSTISIHNTTTFYTSSHPSYTSSHTIMNYSRTL